MAAPGAGKGAEPAGEDPPGGSRSCLQALLLLMPCSNVFQPIRVGERACGLVCGVTIEAGQCHQWGSVALVGVLHKPVMYPTAYKKTNMHALGLLRGSQAGFILGTGDNAFAVTPVRHLARVTGTPSALRSFHCVFNIHVMPPKCAPLPAAA